VRLTEALFGIGTETEKRLKLRIITLSNSGRIKLWMMNDQGIDDRIEIIIN
jgi:hypothetical protein